MATVRNGFPWLSIRAVPCWSPLLQLSSRYQPTSWLSVLASMLSTSGSSTDTVYGKFVARVVMLPS